jgi:hypothetical protein
VSAPDGVSISSPADHFGTRKEQRLLAVRCSLWVQSSLAQKQRLQQVFFPEGVRFDGKELVGTGMTLPVFNYLNPISDEKKEVVDLTGIEPVTS